MKYARKQDIQYRSTVNHYDYICDLGDRLEFDLANGQTVNIWVDQPNTIEEYAECEASTIRSYENGNSKDTTCNATEEEKQILKPIFAVTLSAIRSGKDKQIAMDVAENIGYILLGKRKKEDVMLMVVFTKKFGNVQII